MSALARLLVERHATIAKVVLPVSICSGFYYTATYGTNPLRDMAAVLSGTSAPGAADAHAVPQVTASWRH